MNDKIKKEMKKYIDEEIIGEPQLGSKELEIVNNILTKILRESDQKTRTELRNFLKRWEVRTLFVDALQEEKDIQDKKALGNNKERK